MEYRDVINLLAGFHQIDDDGMGAFKARVHILRKLGVPQLSQPGKGGRARFSRDDLAQLHLALTMGENGFSPTRIVELMKSIRAMKQWWPMTQWENEWLLVTLRAHNGDLSERNSQDIFQGITVVQEQEVMAQIKRWSANHNIALWHSMINLGQIARDLQSAPD